MFALDQSGSAAVGVVVWSRYSGITQTLDIGMQTNGCLPGVICVDVCASLLPNQTK